MQSTKKQDGCARKQGLYGMESKLLERNAMGYN